MNYTKSFQNAQALSVSVVNTYSEDQMIHTFMNNFLQGGKYSAQIASHQAELRRQETFTDQKYLSSSSLQTDYLKLDSSAGCGKNSKRAKNVQTKCTFCGGVNHSAEKNSKGSDRKSKKIVRLMLWTTDEQNGHLEKNLHMDLRIT